ncbi:MAG TPA: hypothetical protein PKC65_06875 [Pyrinomonadaceae bacterium]|nr:hypothetical protein [Pyrinomonadaceae bacterium]
MKAGYPCLQRTSCIGFLPLPDLVAMPKPYRHYQKAALSSTSLKGKNVTASEFLAK